MKVLPILFLETVSCILHWIKPTSFLWQLGSCFQSQPVRKESFVSDLHFCFEKTIDSINKTNAVFVSLRCHNLHSVCLTIWDKMNCDKIDFTLQWVNLTREPRDWSWRVTVTFTTCQSHKCFMAPTASASAQNFQALADPYATFPNNQYLSWFLNLKITAHRQKHDLEKKLS